MNIRHSRKQVLHLYTWMRSRLASISGKMAPFSSSALKPTEEGLAWWSGGPVIETLCFHCRRQGLIPGWGTENPHATKCSQKKNQEQKTTTKKKKKKKPQR